jgi:hypothetical protein
MAVQVAVASEATSSWAALDAGGNGLGSSSASTRSASSPDQE